MRRFGQVIGLKPEKLDEYMELHKAVWPDILKLISDCNMINYSIYYKNGLLFAYFEYIGEDFDADMKKMSDNPVNEKWWNLCKPCQVPVENAAQGEWWADMEEVFHLD